MKKVSSQFDEVNKEVKETTETAVRASSIALDMDKYKTKKEKEKEKDAKTRVFLFLEPALAKRLDRAAKRYGKGFKSDFTSDVLEKALDALEVKENNNK